MKITDIRVTHVNVPFDAPFWWTAGTYGGASKSIIEVFTDEGIVGLGEAPWWHFGEVIKAEIAPALVLPGLGALAPWRAAAADQVVERMAS